MIISKNFVIGHIPKTGGHAVGVMLSKVLDLDYINPFVVNEKQEAHTISNGISKHRPFTDIDIAGKKLFLVMRHLPSWLLTLVVHESLHYDYDDKKPKKRSRLRSNYWDEFSSTTRLNILNEPIVSSCNFPDQTLKKFSVGKLDITWLRMEYLAEDIIKHLAPYCDTAKAANDIKAVSKTKHSYGKFAPKRYWSKRGIETLYQNNPLWASIEKKVY